jgi:hypothetical protein
VNLLALFALEIELRRWAALGRIPLIWWRDDDARDATPALDRLLDLADGLPLSLAIIPDGDRSRLGARLARLTTVTASQHGVDHVNRSAPGQPASEYATGVATADKIVKVARGRNVLLAAGLDPVFYTPPWNAIDGDLPEVVRAVGYGGISAHEGSAPTRGLARVDCGLDVMRWKGRPRFRGRGAALRRLARLLRERRRAGAFERPIGLLTHHLAQDEPSWAFLQWFLTFARRRFAWRSFAELTPS